MVRKTLIQNKEVEEQRDPEGRWLKLTIGNDEQSKLEIIGIYAPVDGKPRVAWFRERTTAWAEGPPRS